MTAPDQQRPMAVNWRNMKQLIGIVFFFLLCCQQSIAQSLDDLAAKAEQDIADRFASFGLEGMRGQLVAPGKNDEEKDRIIMTAVRELARCYVTTSIEFAEEKDLSAETLLRWQAGWELSEADRDTMTRLDDNAFRKSQEPCKKAFLDALPMRVG